MVAFLEGGHVDVVDLGEIGQVTLIHGGAGPEDPKDGATGEAVAALDRVIQGMGLPENPDQMVRGLKARDTALAPVERRALAAAMLLENEPCFNAGYGAALQEDGQARVSAAFMESRRRTFSAVMNVRDVRHPAYLAAYLQQERFPVLDTHGAENLAWRLGMARESLVVPHRFERWLALRDASLKGPHRADGKGTVGCVGFAAPGRLAAVTSTGGVGNETVGRVGDTPTVAGNFCTERTAVSCTGYGEHILNQGFAVQLATRCDDGGDLIAGMRRGLKEAEQRGFGLAAIALHWDQRGRVTWCAGSTESFFIWALHTPACRRLFSEYL
ncbi:isoaspartyl peptidase/L-asparaginase [Acanthopleuribacter pedis]|uniref:Isoaspartyl peptidase/L-asparaginase n=1 Tax=Acanthopleuribacter pedis TaxID=442870 RepID=A0A8J7Q5L1_9BACT|nr:isoaspartyl peptidase/L-asparaginase [Acanthopleuribacter pedis]MBO1318391.1 isoaspartyl peptidase/L-asparaginase [Acanthopleuribacter pedis]